MGFVTYHRTNMYEGPYFLKAYLLKGEKKKKLVYFQNFN